MISKFLLISFLCIILLNPRDVTVIIECIITILKYMTYVRNMVVNFLSGN